MELDVERRLGRKLTECRADKVKIAIQAGWRTAFCLILDITNLGGISAIQRWNETPPDIAIIILDLILTIVFGLFPLIHLREYLAFYENGIIYRKRPYFWSELGSAGWRNHTMGGIFNSTLMDTDIKVFNVTYVKNPKKQYNRAYMNH